MFRGLLLECIRVYADAVGVEDGLGRLWKQNWENVLIALGSN
jgi:hypothetical protein